LHVAEFYIKKNLAKKAVLLIEKNCSRTVRFCWPYAAGPALPLLALWVFASGPAAAAAQPLCRMLHAASWRQPAAQPLGHLGHLGHGFKLQAGAGGHCHWVIWVIVF
jgi:hypothetical protein